MKHTFIAVIAVTILISAVLGPKDDSDPINSNPFDRSGMAIHHDQLTGCEYVSRPFAGITPRLDESGRQLCRKNTP